METIYIEDEAAVHPRALRILERFPRAERVPCRRYGEVFNRRAQSFRLQKRRPALILARKFDRFLLETPGGYGLGGARNYYFSHMLNCVYDCRYCFLQGMYQSAFWVVFVNYEDFAARIAETVAAQPGEACWFFSGYDCDSLAFDAVTGFAEHFLPFFETLDGAWLELRTKSTRIRPLLARAPLERAVVAVSLAPDRVARALEHGAPPPARRLEALRRIGLAGWKLGLRFDPLVGYDAFRKDYAALIEAAFEILDPAWIHSVTLGPLRFPKAMYEAIRGLYPEEPLFAGPLAAGNGRVSYPEAMEAEMRDYCASEIRRALPAERIFHAVSEAPVR